jgi:hypothetical protein
LQLLPSIAAPAYPPRKKPPKAPTAAPTIFRAVERRRVWIALSGVCPADVCLATSENDPGARRKSNFRLFARSAPNVSGARSGRIDSTAILESAVDCRSLAAGGITNIPMMSKGVIVMCSLTL